MKKTLNIGIILGILVIPAVTFASWYNPLSWFKKASISVPASVETPAEVPVTAPQPIPSPKPIITNTITVENPKLQAQINTLIQQNTDLQSQLVGLTAKYNNLVATNASLSAQVKILADENTALKAPKETTQPADQNVNVVTRDPIQEPGNIFAFPLTITNQSDDSVILTAIQYEFSGNVVKTSVSTAGDMSNSIDGTSATYQLTNSLTIQGNQATTIYINAYAPGNTSLRLYVRGFQATKNTVHFSF